MVGTPYGEILLKALSHFGLVRVPRERVTPDLMGKRGRQYTVLAIVSPRITATSSIRDYLKMVLCREFDEVMDYSDVAAEK